ncbi:hypothetical protein MT881_002455 [Enterococcus faecium]|nr:hypothetical protein [Enterococcus faecium]
MQMERKELITLSQDSSSLTSALRLIEEKVDYLDFSNAEQARVDTELINGVLHMAVYLAEKHERELERLYDGWACYEQA